MTLRSGAFEEGSAVGAPDFMLETARQLFAERGFSGSCQSGPALCAGWDDGDGRRPVRMDDLFITLWRQHQTAHDAATSEAVAQARQTGVGGASGSAAIPWRSGS
jgi:hypothetical protein